MKRITITVPEAVARWARAWAARHDTSVSKLVGELLTARMSQENAYEAAMKRFLSKPAVRLREPHQPLPLREELHHR